MFCSTQNEFVEAVTTIAPPSPCAITRPASCMHRKTPVRLTSSTRCQLRSSISSSGLTSAMPAWAIIASRRPNASMQVLTAARTSSRLLTSPATARTGPDAASSAAVAAASSPSRSTITTPAPSARKRSATARPMPLRAAGDDDRSGRARAHR